MRHRHDCFLRLTLTSWLLVACSSSSSATPSDNIDCSSSYTVGFTTPNGAWAGGSYTISVVFDGTTAECSFSAPAQIPATAGVPTSLTCTSNGSTTSVVAASVGSESTCSSTMTGTGAGQGCTPIAGRFILGFSIGGKPTSVKATLAKDGMTLVSQDIAPQYTQQGNEACFIGGTTIPVQP